MHFFFVSDLIFAIYVYITNNTEYLIKMAFDIIYGGQTQQTYTYQDKKVQPLHVVVKSQVKPDRYMFAHIGNTFTYFQIYVRYTMYFR